MWQNNERKARFIEAALSGDRTIRRLEDVGSQANQFAMAKAIASGDSRLMQKAGLESEIARLQRQRAAHVDDQHADPAADPRRTARPGACRGADQGDHRATWPGGNRPVATQFTMEIEGRTITQRKAAGASLLTKMRLAARERAARRWTVGRIGGFDLTCDIQSGRHDLRPEPHLALERTDFPQSIDIDGETTPVGIIARLEHALDRMEAELEEQRRRVTDAQSPAGRLRAAPGRDVPLAGRTGRQARPACRDRGGPRQHRGHRRREPSGAAESHRRLNGVGLPAAPFPAPFAVTRRLISSFSQNSRPSPGDERRAQSPRGPPQPRARFHAASHSAKGDPSWAGSTNTNRSTIPSLT